MALKKYLVTIAVALALCGFQGAEGLGFVGQSVQMAQEIQSDFIRVVSLASQQAANIMAELLRTSLSVRADAIALLERSTGALAARIAEVRKVAAQAVCGAQADVQRVQLLRNLTESVVACITDKVDEARGLMRSVEALVKEANATIEDAQLKIAECEQSGGLQAVILVCQTNEKAQAVVAAAKLAAAVFDELMKVQHLVLSLRDAVSTCPQTRIDEARKQSNLLQQQIAQCVADHTS